MSKNDFVNVIPVLSPKGIHKGYVWCPRDNIIQVVNKCFDCGYHVMKRPGVLFCSYRVGRWDRYFRWLPDKTLGCAK